MGKAITGREVTAALKRGTTWGQAAACGAGDGILLKTIGIKPQTEILKDDSLGLANHLTADRGKDEVSGSPEAYLRYDGFDLVYALIMGQAGTPVQQGESAVYANHFDLSDDTDGLFATVAYLLKSDVVAECPGVKITGLTIKGEMNAALEASLEVIADRQVYDSSANTPQGLRSVTGPEHKNRVIMNGSSAFRLNMSGGDALGAGDAIFPTGFELSVTRACEGDYGPGIDGLSEPEQTAQTEVSLTLNFPRYDDRAHAFLAGLRELDEYKAELTFTGPPIGGVPCALTFALPRLIADEAAPEVGGPGKINSSVKLTAYEPDAAPAGMDGVASPLRISVVNHCAVNPLEGA